MSPRKIGVTELVLRDAHQSLMATRMALEDMVDACADIDAAGYWSVECWGGATFDSCIRFLNEDPWVRLRTFRELMPNTRLQMLLRGQNLLGYRHYEDTVVEEFVEKSAENGMDVFRVFDALNDPRNMAQAMQAVKKVGKHAQGTICYTISPVHTVEGYVKLAGQLIDMVGLGPKAKVLSTKLSGGQRRRLDVAVGVVGRPRLLFLDEPTTGLDPEARREAWELVRLLTGTGMTTVLTTHYLDEAQELSQRAGIIIRGKIVHVGTLSELARLTGRRYRVSYDLDPLVEVPLSLAERMKSQPHSCLYGTDEPTALLRLLLDAAQRHGIAEIPGLQITQPSLEQIYINMVEQAKEHR